MAATCASFISDQDAQLLIARGLGAAERLGGSLTALTMTIMVVGYGLVVWYPPIKNGLAFVRLRLFSMSESSESIYRLLHIDH